MFEQIKDAPMATIIVEAAQNGDNCLKIMKKILAIARLARLMPARSFFGSCFLM